MSRLREEHAISTRNLALLMDLTLATRAHVTDLSSLLKAYNVAYPPLREHSDDAVIGHGYGYTAGSHGASSTALEFRGLSQVGVCQRCAKHEAEDATTAAKDLAEILGRLSPGMAERLGSWTGDAGQVPGWMVSSWVETVNKRLKEPEGQAELSSLTMEDKSRIEATLTLTLTLTLRWRIKVELRLSGGSCQRHKSN